MDPAHAPTRAMTAHPRVWVVVLLAIAWLLCTAAPGRAASGDLDPTWGVGGVHHVPMIMASNQSMVFETDASDRTWIVSNVMVNGTSSMLRIARFTTTGMLDASFGGGDGIVEHAKHHNNYLVALMPQPDGKMVLGEGSNCNCADEQVLRFNSDGSLDATFGAAGIAVVPRDLANVKFALAPNGKIAVAAMTAANTTFTTYQLLPDGTADLTFGINGFADVPTPTSASLHGIAYDAANRVVGTRRMTTSDVMRLTTAGLPDPTFGTAGFATIANSERQGLLTQSDNKIIIAESTNRLTRITAAGAIDLTYGTAGTLTLPAPPSGTIRSFFIGRDSSDRVVGAIASSTGEVASFRATTAGAMDTSYTPTGVGAWAAWAQPVPVRFVGDITLDSANRLLSGGSAMYDLGTSPRIVRHTAAGAIDTSYDGDGFVDWDAAALQSWSMDSGARLLRSGTRLIWVGWISRGSAQTFAARAIDTATGALDPSWGGSGQWTAPLHQFGLTDWSTALRDIELQPDGKLLVAASMNNPAGASRAHVFRLHATGTLDLSFGSGGVRQISDAGLSNAPDWGHFGVLSTGKIYTAWTSNSGDRAELVRLNADGTTDAGFTRITWPDVRISDVVVQGDESILLIGYSNATTPSRLWVAKLTPAGALDTTFGPSGVRTHEIAGAGITTKAAIVDANGRIVIVCGCNGSNGLTRLEADGDLDLSFNGTGYSTNAAFGALQAVTVDLAGTYWMTGGSIQVSSITKDGQSNLDFSADGTSIAHDVSSSPDEQQHFANDIHVEPNGRILTGAMTVVFTGDQSMDQYVVALQGTTPPAVPTLVAPADATFVSTTPDMTGSYTDPDGSAGRIEAQICSDSTCSTLVQTAQGGTVASGANSTATASPALTLGVQYWWRARALDFAGNASAWTATRTFTTANVPNVTDNQLGDATWRRTNTTTYDVDFAAGTGTITSLQTRAWSGAGQSGTMHQDWTVFATPGTASYTTDWSLTGSTWSALAEGVNFVSVRVQNSAAMTSTGNDVFEVRKDTIAPTAVGTLSATTPTTSLPSLTWSAATDATSGISYYSVYRSTTGCGGAFSKISTDGSVTGTGPFTDSTAPFAGTLCYRVHAVDVAGNEQLSGNATRAVIHHRAPATPTLVAPVDGASNQVNQPALIATHSDLDLDTGTISFQLCSDAACSSVVASGSSSVGISSGANGTWTVGSVLPNGTLYWWRAMATDSNLATSAWSATQSFTTVVTSFNGSIGTFISKPAVASASITTTATVGVGSTVIITVAHAGATPTVTGISDSAGNRYRLDRATSNGTNTTSQVWSAFITDTLPSGGTINVTLGGSIGPLVVHASSFGGVRYQTNAVNGATASSTAPSASVTTTYANALIVGGIAVNGSSTETFTATAPNTAMSSIGTTGGGATSNQTLHGTWRFVTATGTFAANGTLSNSRAWSDSVVAYMTATGVGAPTPAPGASITGQPYVGETLTGDNGTWTGSPTFDVFWSRCNAAGTSCQPIAGATGATYVPIAGDIGSTIRYTVIATNAGGSVSSKSAVTAVIANAPAPVNTALPTISGTANDGSTLTATQGTWTTVGTTTYAYQWRRCDAAGASCVNIAGATLSTYDLVTADVGSTLRIVVTATNSGGATPATSAASARVTGDPPANSVLPSISGTTIDGQVLTAANGTWTGTTPLTYARQWRRCDAAGASCVDIVGETGASYTLTSTDIGSTIRVDVTATNTCWSGCASIAATSSQSAVITGAPPANVTLPSISGTANDGSTLTAADGTWSGSATITYAYQWQRCNASGTGCVDIGGQTASTYVLVSADVSGTIRVRVTATNPYGSTSATSAASAVVSGDPPANSVLPAISGTANDGELLTASSGTWTGTTPITYTYQWRRCDSAGAACSDIASATASTYTLTSTDVGSTIRVVVTATNSCTSGCAAVAATSTQSARVTGDPPANSVLPAISGTANDGELLTASTGTWTGTTPITYTYQWRRCDSAGAACSDIASATASTYTLTSTDVGSTIRVVVTATNTCWSGCAATSATSTQSARVTGDTPSNSVLPGISGTTTQGLTLTATSGTWAGTTAITYAWQWRRCDSSGAACADIAGATASTYVLVAGDVGSTIRVVVTASNSCWSGCGSTAATSAQSTVVTPPISVTSTSPNTGPQGRRGLTVQVNGSGFVNGATVSFSGAGISVTSTTWVSAARIDVTIDITGAAATGARDVTVTNPDLSTATGTGAFTITAASISIAMSTLGYNDGARDATAPFAVSLGALFPGSVAAVGPAGSGQTLAGSAFRITVTSDTTSQIDVGATQATNGSNPIPYAATEYKPSASGTWRALAATTTADTDVAPGTTVWDYDYRVTVPAAQAPGAYTQSLTWTVIAKP